MSTKEQSATLLRLNKQEQVKALQAVGFADITENSRASEFPNRIKWAAGLLDMRVACNRISDNSKWYFTRMELIDPCQQVEVYPSWFVYPGAFAVLCHRCTRMLCRGLVLQFLLGRSW